MTNILLQWYLWYLTTAHIVMSLRMPIYYVCIYFFLHNIVLRVRNKGIYIYIYFSEPTILTETDIPGGWYCGCWWKRSQVAKSACGIGEIKLKLAYWKPYIRTLYVAISSHPGFTAKGCECRVPSHLHETLVRYDYTWTTLRPAQT